MYYLTHPYFLIPGLCTLTVFAMFYFGLRDEAQDRPINIDTASISIEFIQDHSDNQYDENLGVYTSDQHLPSGGYRTTTIEIDGRHFHLDIADDSQTRTRGLSYRPSISSEQGMFFVFERPGPQGIWMKEMNFPLDIVWLDQNKTVVHIERNISPDTFPSVFESPVDALYVIELPAGSI